MKEKIAILGAGSWGTALAQVLADNGHAPLLWSIEPETVVEINEKHTLSKFFGGTRLNDAISATGDLALTMQDAKFVVLAVPSGAVRSVLIQALPYLVENAIVINTAKGFDPSTNERMSCTIRAVLGTRNNPEVNLIGPSHAEEVVNRMITSICAVGTNHDAALAVQDLFSGSYLRLYVTTDEIGAEYGAIMKNIIALAAGMIDGRGCGDNAKAALVTRGLNEMIRYGTAKGGHKDTFFGLTGVGDLIVTCLSPHSRNYQAGRAIGQANEAATFLRENTGTVEGIAACKVVAEDAARNNLDMPIISAVYAVLYQGETPASVIRKIMGRPLKEEGFDE